MSASINMVADGRGGVGSNDATTLHDSGDPNPCSEMRMNFVHEAQKVLGIP